MLFSIHFSKEYPIISRNRKDIHENEKQEIDILDELNKGATMGQDAIFFILDKVEDLKLKAEIENQYQAYKEISEKIHKVYPNYSAKEPHETNLVNKALTWYGIEMKTLMDTSTSKITELLLQGTNMGIIEGRKLLNHKSPDPKVYEIIEEYVKMQEKAVEKLKKFL